MPESELWVVFRYPQILNIPQTAEAGGWHRAICGRSAQWLRPCTFQRDNSNPVHHIERPKTPTKIATRIHMIS